MTDEIDLAAELRAADEQALVECVVQRARRPRAAPRHGAGGQRICIECEQPISAQRLAAVPNAVACRDCEAAAERHARNFRRSSPWAV